MPAYRKLPSGKWQATVRLPDGRRVTQTDPLKKVVREWATQVETEARRGTWRDPRLVVLTVGTWHAKWSAGRVVEAETARADEGSWRLHLRDTFENRPIRDVTRSEVAAWVKSRLDAGVGPSAIRRALNYLKALLEGAVDEELLQGNVARKVLPPTRPQGPADWYTQDEVSAITNALRDAGRESDACMVELMCWVGLRWGEAAAVRGDDIDWLRHRVSITHVLTQAGRDKAYPKTSSSVREVPVPPWLIANLGALLAGRTRDARIFVTRRDGRDLSAANWRKTYDAALVSAGVDRGTPHTLRHTCASWLVQEGVSIYDVSRQLGHASVQVTQRYAHLRPDVHAPVTSAWARLDALPTHERTQGSGEVR
jgi:integrase